MWASEETSRFGNRGLMAGNMPGGSAVTTSSKVGYSSGIHDDFALSVCVLLLSMHTRTTPGLLELEMPDALSAGELLDFVTGIVDSAGRVSLSRIWVLYIASFLP